MILVRDRNINILVSKGLKLKGNVIAPKDIHSNLLILVRDRYIYILVLKGLKLKGHAKSTKRHPLQTAGFGARSLHFNLKGS